MTTNLQTQIVNSIEAQLRELQPGREKQLEIAIILADLVRLKNILARIDNQMVPMLDDQQGKGVIVEVTKIQSGGAELSNFGGVLVELYALQQSIEGSVADWISRNMASLGDVDQIRTFLRTTITSVRALLNYRPDVGAIMDDLSAIKNLRGGPADAVSFHDFNVLQLAFKSVWLHAFDRNLKDAAEQLFEETVRLYDYAGVTMPPVDSIEDMNQLKAFLSEIRASVVNGVVVTPPAGLVPPLPGRILSAFPAVTSLWHLLSSDQRGVLSTEANVVLDSTASDQDKDRARRLAEDVLKSPAGIVSRISKLLLDLELSLKEPYAFDVFAPDSYNFGLMITYRQKWEPGEYQAGNLAATIPLAPGESRKFSKKVVVKKTRAEKEIEKSMSSRSLQSSLVSRAESEIMQKVTTATNFKMTAHGSFNVGVGSIDATNEFAINQDQLSALTKKEFHEATIKATEEYRLERSLEVDTTSSVETEETVSGEISNPNNEITVTYLFYELQRRYRVHEFLYRVRPVILVAQDMPAPHQIDESWLIQYQWIIARVLLDDSLRPALDYLTSGYAGDEVSIEVIKASWEAQARLVKSLEGQVKSQLTMRNALRETLVQTALKKSLAQAAEMSTAQKVFTLGLAPDPAETAADILEANRQAAETRLKYVEEALADAQSKLKQATGSFQEVTKDYATAMQNQYARRVAIDQLRIHVKQNIFYYMQAIWDHEPPDQRFFRLYKKTMLCAVPVKGCVPDIVNTQGGKAHKAARDARSGAGAAFNMQIQVCPPFGLIDGTEHELVEVADLDNPLGYKGNYIIFPLKDPCYLTDYMVTEFIDSYLGVRDPDGSDDFDAEDFDRQWKQAVDGGNKQTQEQLKKNLIKYITAVRRSTDEIIIPTGQLFIEALPGSHPLLEDYKLLHRIEDVRKVKAEVRHAELENLRLAARLDAGQADKALLEDPDIEKKIVVEGNTSVVVNPP